MSFVKSMGKNIDKSISRNLIILKNQLQMQKEQFNKQQKKMVISLVTIKLLIELQNFQTIHNSITQKIIIKNENHNENHKEIPNEGYI